MNSGEGEIDFRRTTNDVLAVVAERGYLYVADFVTPAVVRNVREWVEQQRFTRHDMDTATGVRQRLETVESHDLQIDGYGAFFIEAVERWVRHAGTDFPSLKQWQATDIAVQKYQKGDGISPHRDYRRQQGPIIVVSVAGEAEFSVHQDRYAAANAKFRVHPGDAVLLRGDLGFKKSDRPVHSVSAPLTAEPRISLGLRYDRRIKT